MNKEYKITYSPEAVRDLEGIKEYIATELDSPAAAKKLLRKLMDRVTTLSRFPKSGEALDGFVSVKTDYRRLVCGNYLVFYRAEHGEVNVVRVIHGSRNYARILFGYTPESDTEVE